MALCGIVGGKDGKGVPLLLPLPLRGLCGLRTQAQAKHAFPVSWMRSAVARFPRGEKDVFLPGRKFAHLDICWLGWENVSLIDEKC